MRKKEREVQWKDLASGPLGNDIIRSLSSSLLLIAQLSLLCVVTSFSSTFQVARELGCPQLSAYIISFRSLSGKRPLSPNIYISVPENSYRPCLGCMPTPILITMSAEWGTKIGWAGDVCSCLFQKRCSSIGRDCVMASQNSERYQAGIFCLHCGIQILSRGKWNLVP